MIYFSTELCAIFFFLADFCFRHLMLIAISQCFVSFFFFKWKVFGSDLRETKWQVFLLLYHWWCFSKRRRFFYACDRTLLILNGINICMFFVRFRINLVENKIKGKSLSNRFFMTVCSVFCVCECDIYGEPNFAKIAATLMNAFGV